MPYQPEYHTYAIPTDYNVLADSAAAALRTLDSMRNPKGMRLPRNSLGCVALIAVSPHFDREERSSVQHATVHMASICSMDAIGEPPGYLFDATAGALHELIDEHFQEDANRRVN